MISEVNPAQTGLRPPAPAVAAANAAANRPSTEDIHRLAQDMRKGLLPENWGAPTASLPGLGGHLDLYDTVGKPAKGLHGGGKDVENMFQAMGAEFSQGLTTLEAPPTPHDFPYLKPLAARNLGNRLNTLI